MDLLYLIIQFFIIDERVKETKIFSLTNYNNLAPEARIGVTELITEVKSLQEANSIYHKNMKKLELVNRRLREDMKNLEEDFLIIAKGKGFELINIMKYNLSSLSHSSKFKYEPVFIMRKIQY